MTELSIARRPDALLLDAGDTLLFMDPDAVRDALADQGVAVESERIRRALHPAKRRYQELLATGRNHEDGWNVLVGSMLELAGLDPATAGRMLAPLRRVHDDFYFWRCPPENLVPALQRARTVGIRLGVVSNSEGRLDSVLTRVGLRHHFEIVVDSHLEGVNKPNPEIFRRALDRLGIAADRAVYAGDIPEVDVVGASRVGMHGVLIDAFGDYPERDDLDRVASVAELVDLLVALPHA